MIRERIHIDLGKREWELQATTDGGYLHWSGPPFLTKGQARRGLRAWKAFDFFNGAQARNVRTGERLR